MLTSSHDDKCFYVAEMQGALEASRRQQEVAGEDRAESGEHLSVYDAQEGNITFKQLSAEHQQ